MSYGVFAPSMPGNRLKQAMSGLQAANSEALKTARQLVLWGEQRFLEAELQFGHGTETALDEAAWLVAHALGTTPDFTGVDLDAPLDADTRGAAVMLLEKRLTERRPAAYLIHEAWFDGLAFYVDERVLVPRSPIAELIQDRFQPWIPEHKVTRILDLCTGSGCIAISSALAFPQAEVDASDISPEALAVARINVQRHGLEQRVQLLESDLFANLAQKGYDIIVSNPPYVDRHDMEARSIEHQHEPVLGLTAGEQGLDLAVPILQAAAAYLQPHGILILEVGNSAEALQARFPQVPFLWLEFVHGGEGVLLLEARQLLEYQDIFKAV